jgi:hypothetical protein
MSNIIGIASHPKFKSAIGRRFDEFLTAWAGIIREPDPKRINFLRVDRTEEEAQHLEALYAKGILSDSQRVMFAETTEELQTIADELGVDLNDKE